MCRSTYVLSSWGWVQFWKKSLLTLTVHLVRHPLLVHPFLVMRRLTIFVVVRQFGEKTKRLRLNRHDPDTKITCWMCNTSRRVKNSSMMSGICTQTTNLAPTLSTDFERNHVVHVAGNSARDYTDNEWYCKTRPPSSYHQNLANLDTFAREQIRVSR